ncbi:MAG: hypothetical protein ACOX2P_04570 [Bacillota bacterium]
MNTNQKVLTLLLILSLTLTLAACGGSGDGDQAEEMLEIGIIQIAPHPSLDNCYQGFIEGLASEGFTGRGKHQSRLSKCSGRNGQQRYDCQEYGFRAI